MRILPLCLCFTFASFVSAEPAMPSAEEILESARRMEEISNRIELQSLQEGTAEQREEERKRLTKEVLEAIRQTDEILLAIPEAQENFNFWYPKQRALASILHHAEEKPAEEAWQILREIYDETDRGLGVVFSELAPSLVRVRLRLLMERGEDGLPSKLPPFPEAGREAPEFVRELPEELKACWRLASGIEEVSLSLPLLEDSTRGELDYSRSKDLYYTLMAHSVIRSEWQDAHAIGSCDWGHFCGTGADDFTSQRDAYVVLVSLLNPGYVDDGKISAFLLRALLQGSQFGVPIFGAARDPFAGNSSSVSSTPEDEMDWRELAWKRLGEDTEKREDVIAGILMFGKDGLAQHLAYQLPHQSSERVVGLACLALEHEATIGKDLNTDVLDTLLATEVKDPALQKRIAVVMANRVGRIEDAHLLGSFVDRLVGIPGEESNHALFEIAKVGASKAAKVARGELDHRGVDFSALPEITRESEVFDFVLRVNGSPFRGFSLGQQQEFETSSGLTRQSWQLPTVRGDEEGRFEIEREDFMFFDEDRAFLTLYPHRNPGEKGASQEIIAEPDSDIFLVRISAAKLLARKEISLFTQRVVFEAETPGHREEIVAREPRSLTLYQGMHSFRIEFPPGAPLVLESVGMGNYRGVVHQAGCLPLHFSNLIVGEKEVQFDLGEVKSAHRLTWEGADEWTYLLRRKAEGENLWIQTHSGSASEEGWDVSPGRYHLEIYDETKPDDQRLIAEREFQIEPDEPYLRNLGRIETKLEDGAELP